MALVIYLSFMIATTITFILYYRKKVGFSFSKGILKKSGIISIFFLVGIILAVGYAHFLTGSIAANLNALNELSSQISILFILFLAIIFGIVWGYILSHLMQYLSKFVKNELFDIKLLMVLVIVFLAFTINHIITIPLMMLFSSAFSLPFPETNIVYGVLFVLGALEQYLTSDFVAFFNIVMQLWVPIVFFIYILKDLKNSEKKFSSKLFNLSIAISVLIIIGVIANENTLHFSSQGESASFQATFVNGMIFATAIIGFLTAKGFIMTFKNNMSKLKGTDPESSNQKIHQKIKSSKKAWFGLMLFINIFGFLQFFFLLGIPVKFNPINEFVLTGATFLATNVYEDIKPQAQIVSSIFMLFFMFFVVYGLSMLLRGYGKQFLTKENRLYKFFNSRIGPNSAIVFVALITVFVGGGLILSNNLIVSVGILPDWVQDELGYKAVYMSSEFTFLRDAATTVGTLFFFKGIGFAIGFVYTIIMDRRNRI